MMRLLGQYRTQQQGWHKRNTDTGPGEVFLAKDSPSPHGESIFNIRFTYVLSVKLQLVIHMISLLQLTVW